MKVSSLMIGNAPSPLRCNIINFGERAIVSFDTETMKLEILVNRRWKDWSEKEKEEIYRYMESL